MIMNFILVIWTVVGFAGGNGSYDKAYGWQAIGDFQHQAGCERAAVELGITNPKNFRCLKKNGS